MTNTMHNELDSRIARQICLSLAIFLIVVGFMLDSPLEIVRGLFSYMNSSNILLTDYFVTGSMGAALVNAGLVTLMSMGLIKIIHAKYEAITIAMLFLMAGFALFGKNPLNILPFFIGVKLFCIHIGKPMRKYLNAALFSTALAPIVSEIFLKGPFDPSTNLVLGFMVGTLIGYLIVPLAEHSFATHKGYSLFNYGFVCGLIAMLVAALVNSLGGTTDLVLYWYEGSSTHMLIFIGIIIVSLIGGGIYISRDNPWRFIDIFSETGRAPADFVRTYGIGATMINMGLMGVLSLSYILLLDGDLSGPVVGAILTSIGFGAVGEHLKNSIPIMVGVFIASLFMAHDATIPSLQLAALFGTALAPISGSFGPFFGVLSGFLHSAVVLAIGPLCGGFNLYSNGFSAGFVALIMVAVIHGFMDASKIDEEIL